MTEPEFDRERVLAAMTDVPDFPKPGILFKDLTTLLSDPGAFAEALRFFEWRCQETRATHLLAIESRGFLFAAPLAAKLGLPLLLARKPGKLPRATHSASYELEYGSDSLELHRDALTAGDRALIVDDLIATGGTAQAACALVEACGAEIAECVFLIELVALGGAAKLPAASALLRL